MNNNSRREQPAAHPSPQPAAQRNAAPSNAGRQQPAQQAHKSNQPNNNRNHSSQEQGRR
jgi:hypothetical protein